MGRVRQIFTVAAIASTLAFAWIAGSWGLRYAQREAFVARPIGVGDTLHIEVYDIHGYGKDEIADLKVPLQGDVRLPGIGTNLAVSGLSLSQVWGQVWTAYRSNNPYPTTDFWARSIVGILPVAEARAAACSIESTAADGPGRAARTCVSISVRPVSGHGAAALVEVVQHRVSGFRLPCLSVRT